MQRLFAAQGRFVATRPGLTLALVGLMTVFAVFGFTLTADDADPEAAFLPESSEIVAAQDAVAEQFPQFSGLESMQVVLRGDVLSPEGAADALSATEAMADAPDLERYLAPGRPTTSPGHVLRTMLAGDADPDAIDLRSVSQAEIDAAIADPTNVELVAVLEDLVARDDAGAVVGGIGIVSVNDNDNRLALVDAQIAVDEVVRDTPLTGLDSVRTFSGGTLEADSDAATAFAVLMLAALAVILLLLAVFTRQLSDVALGLGGLVLTIVWALGLQGWLGPEALGFIGAPSVSGQMVPIMMIGLCVDYGIQFTSRYREALRDGDDATTGVADAVRGIALPLGLAGGTTAISFFTNLLGDIPGLADFGVVAAVGVMSGLAIFTTAVPAGRVLLDRRRESKDLPLQTRSMAEAIPGAGDLVARISAMAVARPVGILAATGLVTVGFALLATGLGSEFNNADFVARGSDSLEDLEFFDEFFGGSNEPVTVVVEADLTDDRTLRNLFDLSTGLEDPVQRPSAVTSEVTSSLLVVSGSVPPSELARLEDLAIGSSNPLVLEPEIVQEALDIIEASDTDAFAQVVSYGAGEQADLTLLQFDASTSDTEATRSLIDDIDGLWLGDDDRIAPVSGQIIGLEVSDSLADNQLRSIVFTMVAALIVLTLYFAATEFRPVLAALCVAPILLVLVWVLGTMVLLGYSYNVITAMITALSIGVGVDYTIHVTHRFIEEREHGAATIAEAISTTMHTTGGALIGSALTTALAFVIMVFAPIPPIGQFGLLTAITVLYALIASIVVLPPMLVIWAAYHDWRRENLTGLERVEAETLAGIRAGESPWHDPRFEWQEPLLARRMAFIRLASGTDHRRRS